MFRCPNRPCACRTRPSGHPALHLIAACALAALSLLTLAGFRPASAMARHAAQLPLPAAARHSSRAAEPIRTECVGTSPIPIFCTPSPSTAVAGEQITVTVGLNQTTTQDQPVAITTNNGADFENLPSSVTVSAGSSTVSFKVTLASTDASGSATISAACNGTQVSGLLAVQAQS